MAQEPGGPFVNRTVQVRGDLIAFHDSGPPDGHPVVLLHGLASDAGTWDKAAGHLTAHGLRVLAIDLVGHGGSSPSRRGYLLDDFADWLAGFLDALDLRTVTLGGHSLGGAIAVHFSERHRQRVERLVLVSAGGLGRQVHPVLRAAALPVAPAVLRLATGPRARGLYRQPRLHRALGLTPDNLVNLRRAGRALGSAGGRESFFAALRGVIEPGGQRGSFLEMGTFDPSLPVLIVWNVGDPVIPVAHARAAREHLPGSRLVVFPEKGHEPHRRSAERFAREVADFVGSRV